MSKSKNPRQIAKLCKHLRDAGAIEVTVHPDGTVNAKFPPAIHWNYPAWWFNPTPYWVYPNWTITYGPPSLTYTVSGGSSSMVSASNVSRGNETFTEITADPNAMAWFNGYNQLDTVEPVFTEVTLTPTA